MKVLKSFVSVTILALALICHYAPATSVADNFVSNDIMTCFEDLKPRPDIRD